MKYNHLLTILNVLLHQSLTIIKLQYNYTTRSCSVTWWHERYVYNVIILRITCPTRHGRRLPIDHQEHTLISAFAVSVTTSRPITGRSSNVSESRLILFLFSSAQRRVYPRKRCYDDCVVVVYIYLPNHLFADLICVLLPVSRGGDV